MTYTDHDPVTGDPLPIKNLTSGQRHTADGYGALDADVLMWDARPALGSDEEPLKMGSLVVDASGDRWKRGRIRWTCIEAVDNVRIFRVARLHWGDLRREYGPLRRAS